MFWGLIMEPQKRYSQKVEKSFHVSMAALDINSCTDEPVQVMCGFESRKYLLCTLQKGKIFQNSLDLNFDVGDEISFVTNGTSHVHLTGYLNDDVMDDLDVEDDDDDEEEVTSDIGNISPSNIVSGKRPKIKVSAELQPPAKKSKTMELLAEINSLDEDDSDDSDVNLSDVINDEDDDEETTFLEEDDDSDVDEEEEDDDEDGAEEEDEDDDDDERLEVEDSDEVSSLSDAEEEKPKMNGSAKKKEVVKEKGKKDKKQAVTPMKTKAEKKKEGKTPQMEKTKQSPAKTPKVENAASPQKKIVEGGVAIEDLRVGNGTFAKPGKMVQVYYEGRFKNNNKMFDSSTKGNGFRFRLGKQEVIKGWDVGVAGMKVGGKRRIVCPPAMAYGTRGSPPTIPPNSTLVFEVELKNVS